MSTIIQQPDALSFSRNLKKFIVSSAVGVSLVLTQGATEILDETYEPGEGDLVEIDLREIADRLLSIALPSANDDVKEQLTAYADLTATIDGVAVNFRVIKGGVKDFDETAEAFTNDHWLTWQGQDIEILQYQPLWLSLYANTARVVVAKAYFTDDTTETIDLQTLAASSHYTVDVCWTKINAALTKKNPVAWEVWFEDDSDNRLSYIQRYTLRDLNEEENIFIWVNTLGGVDSISFLGYSEDDKGLDHLVAELYDGSFEEPFIKKDRKIRQSTGYLSKDELRRVFDFYYSLKRWRVTYDGTIKAIVIPEDKPKYSKQDDLIAIEFTYQYSEDDTLLNLDRIQTQLSTLSAPSTFFLTSLLSGLPVAQYIKSLLIAVQNPFGIGWQQISIEQLFKNALAEFSSTASIISSDFYNEIKNYISTLIQGIVPGDSSTGIIRGALLWDSGLTFSTAGFDYRILGELMDEGKRSITLDEADATYGRIDTFYLDYTGLQVKKGTPGQNPATPTLLSTELLVRNVLIPVNATEPDGIDFDQVFDENAGEPDEWAAIETHDTNVTVALESVNDPAKGTKCIEVEIAIPDTEIEIPRHYIGQTYQGGKIFYLAADGKSGLIDAGIDTPASQMIYWQSLAGGGSTTGATGSAIGTGAANSALMLANPKASLYAIKHVNAYAGGGYEDWFMPSEKELAEMWKNRYQIGGMGGKTYWSSTEVSGIFSSTKARCIVFDNKGTVYTRDKNNAYYVRAVRAFNDNLIQANQPILTFAPSQTAMTFTKSSSKAVLNGYLSLKIRSSLAWQGNTQLLIEAYLGAAKIGAAAVSSAGNLCGYDYNDPAWQKAIIPMTAFKTTATLIDGFKVSLSGAWTNNIVLGIDDVRYEIYQGTVPDTGIKIIAVTNEQSPTIANYDTLYAATYGQYPRVKLYAEDANGNLVLRADVPTLVRTNGLVTSIVFDLPDAVTGVIVLSK